MFLSEIKGVLSATDADRANDAHDFSIVAEGDDFIVVEKPPFLLVHPTKPTGARTLWGELKHLLAFEIANGGQVSIVNRLDRETSGLVLVAKNAAAARRFGLMMQEQRIAKEYLAIVWGWPEWDSESVDAPLVRQGIHEPSPIWLKQTIHPAGAAGAHRFTVERRFCSRRGRRSLQHHPSDSADWTHASNPGASRFVRPPDRRRQDLRAGRKTLSPVYRDGVDAGTGPPSSPAASRSAFRGAGNRRRRKVDQPIAGRSEPVLSAPRVQGAVEQGRPPWRPTPL